MSAKQKALAEGRTLTSLIEDGLRRVVNEAAEQEQRTPRKAVSLPVSTATGGYLPGMDIRTAEELDDVEYAERMREGFR